MSHGYFSLQIVLMKSCLWLDDSSNKMLTPGRAGWREQCVRSHCSSLSALPALHWWVLWDWTGSQHWLSHESPLCWQPSCGLLEMIEAEGKCLHQYIKETNWSEDALFGQCLKSCTCENFIESSFNISRVQCWCLHEHKTFLLWIGHHKNHN